MQSHSDQLRRIAEGIACDLPPDVVTEVVLTGSVSRGTADAASDIEMLLVTPDRLSLAECEALASAAGVDRLGTWGPDDGITRRVSGWRSGAPVELIWWPVAHARDEIAALLDGVESSSTADALVNGVPLRTAGLFASWQEDLRGYPPELATRRIEAAAMPWGGFHPEGLLTLLRPGDRLALAEWLVDGADRVLAIVYALSREWQPTSKRLVSRIEHLEPKPDRLAERIESSLAEDDPRLALLTMTGLQLEAVRLAPSGPNVDRARRWLADGVEVLRGYER